MGGFGGGFGRDLEALGASWVVFGALFLILVFGVVFKRALGGILAGLWLDFRGVGEGVWEVFGSNFQAFWGILGYCGFFWVKLLSQTSAPALKHPSAVCKGKNALANLSARACDFCWCSLLLAAPELQFEFKISSCFCLLEFILNFNSSWLFC